jgi:hypothetical protein
MPFKAPYPIVALPETDIFSFLFKRKDRTIPDGHSELHKLFVDP